MAETSPPSPKKRSAFYEQAGQHTPFVGAQSGPTRFVVRTGDELAERAIFCEGADEQIEAVAWAAGLAQALGGASAVDQAFIDIGAGVGIETITALVEHGFSRAIALEPDDEARVMLRVNAALNDVEDRIVVLEGPPADDNGAGDAAEAALVRVVAVDAPEGARGWIESLASRGTPMLVTGAISDLGDLATESYTHFIVVDPELKDAPPVRTIDGLGKKATNVLLFRLPEESPPGEIADLLEVAREAHRVAYPTDAEIAARAKSDEEKERDRKRQRKHDLRKKAKRAKVKAARIDEKSTSRDAQGDDSAKA